MRNVICDLEETIRFSSGGNENDYLIPYQEGELIRVLFLFQAASFWPSWESFYLACKDDPRIRVEFTLLDERYGDTTQMLTAQQFLEEKGIAYTPYSDKLFCQFMPHITVMQTPTTSATDVPTSVPPPSRKRVPASSTFPTASSCRTPPMRGTPTS